MPSEWETTTLREIAEFKFSNVDKHIVHGEASVRLCNYLDVYRNRKLTADMPYSEGSARPAEIKRFAIQKGDVLITKDSETPDDIGVPALVVDDLPNTICGYHLAIIRTNGKMDPCFLALHLQSETAKCHFLRFANGVTRFGIGLRAIGSLPVPMPPQDEQIAIARILDAVDVALEWTKKAIAKAELVRSGLATTLLTCGLNEEGRLRDPLASPKQFHVTPVGRVPVAWTVSKVATEFDLATGFTLGEHRRPKVNRRRYLRVANVQRERIDLNDVLELEASDSEMQGRKLEENDLLIVEGHANPYEIGRCALVKAEAVGLTFQNHLFRLRSRGISPMFGCHWLNSEFARRYWRRKCGTSSGLNTINQRMLKSLPVIIPDEKEQERIVAILEAADRKIHEEDERLKKTHKLKRGLMQDLLTGRVRVKLPASSGNGVVRSRT